MSFKDSLERGKKTERAVAFLPALQNYWLVPFTDIHNQMFANGGAPRMWSQRFATGIILPDLAAIGQGHIFPLEVKGKKIPTLTKKTGILEHGVDLRNFRHYWYFADQSGLKLIIVIDEGKTGEILAASLHRLGSPRIYDGSTGKPPMAYWPRTRFMTFHQGEAIDLPLFRGQIVPPTLPRASKLEDL